MEKKYGSHRLDLCPEGRICKVVCAGCRDALSAGLIGNLTEI